MGVVTLALGVRLWDVWLTVVLAFFNIFVIVRLTHKAVAAKIRASRQNVFSAMGDLLNQFPRRYGAYLAHLGVVVIALGIAFSGGYKTEQQVTFAKGETKQVMGHAVTFNGIVGQNEAERDVTAAELTLDGSSVYPRQNFYRVQQTTVATPAIQYHLLGDFYAVFLKTNDAGSQVGIKFINSPLISWIWVGGLILVIGAGLTLIPSVVTEPRAIRKFLIPAVVVVLLAGLLSALLTPQVPANTSTATVTGKVAPDFTLSTLDGKTISLAQFKGQPVVLNFFASWCGPCKDEAPMISTAAQEFKGVVFLGIAYNDKLEKAKEFRDTYSLTFPVVIDDDSDAGRSSVKYALFSVPETYFIDRAGVIQRHNAGPITRTDLESGLKTIGAL